jgi:DNA-binding XRE family transcriptional regulator
MGRSRAELIGGLPADRRAKVEARTRELIDEVEGLKALRRLLARSQAEIAAALGVRQPSVHKMERQADLYLSTLRRFVEAAGGSLELRVEVPGRGVVRLTGVGDMASGGRAQAAPLVSGEEAPARAAVAEERLGYAVEEEEARAEPAAGKRERPGVLRHVRRGAGTTQ